MRRTVAERGSGTSESSTSSSESGSHSAAVTAASVREFVRLAKPRGAPIRRRRVPRIVIREGVKLALVLVGSATEEPERESGEDGQSGQATDNAAGDCARVGR